MKLLHLSDIHGLHRGLGKLPAADVLIHSGDITMAGEIAEVEDFVAWLDGLDYAHKIFIGGNHDLCLDGATVEGLPDGCHYLCNSGVTIGGVRFWGVPYFISDDVAGRCAENMRRIPADTDVLITHRPPLGVLDEANRNDYGCPHILNAVLKRVRPSLHLFGHVHAAYGVCENGGTTFANGALMDENYQLKNQPHVFDI